MRNSLCVEVGVYESLLLSNPFYTSLFIYSSTFYSSSLIFGLFGFVFCLGVRKVKISNKEPNPCRSNYSFLWALEVGRRFRAALGFQRGH